MIIPPLNRTDEPAFEYRQIHCAGHMGNAVWDMRLGLNGAIERPERSEEYGRDYLIRGIHNSLDLLRRPKEDVPNDMFHRHPEIFSEINGKREMRQICATHPGLPNLYARLIRKEYEKWQPEMVSISQMDGGGECRCERCLAANRKAGGEDIYAGSWLPMVNKTAEKIPDIKVWTFAYLWTRKPPQGITANDNVYIWYCLPGVDLGLTTDENPIYRELSDWGQIAPGRLLVWTYDFINNQVEFSYQPSLFFAGNRIRRLHEMGCGGMYIQAGESWATGASFSELQYYVLSKLLWNPYQDENQLIDEFMNAYYQAAAPYVSAYRQLHYELYMAHDPANNVEMIAGQSGIYKTIGEDNVQRLENLLGQAEAAAEDNAIRLRVRVLRLPIWHYRLMQAGRPQWLAKGYAERNGTRRWYVNPDEVSQTISRIIQSDQHVEIARMYLQTILQADVRGFREQPIDVWRDTLINAIREKGLDFEN